MDLIESGEMVFPKQWAMDEEGEQEPEEVDYSLSSSFHEPKVLWRRGIVWTDEHE